MWICGSIITVSIVLFSLNFGLSIFMKGEFLYDQKKRSTEFIPMKNYRYPIYKAYGWRAKTIGFLMMFGGFLISIALLIDDFDGSPRLFDNIGAGVIGFFGGLLIIAPHRIFSSVDYQK